VVFAAVIHEVGWWGTAKRDSDSDASVQSLRANFCLDPGSYDWLSTSVSTAGLLHRSSSSACRGDHTVVTTQLTEYGVSYSY